MSAAKNMLSKFKCPTVALSLLIAAGTAQAGQITFDQLSSDARFATFEHLPLDFGRPGPVSAGGLTFSSGSGWLRTYPNGSIDLCSAGCIMTDSELDYISVTLPTAVAQAGGFIGVYNVANHAQVEFYAGSTLLGTVDIDTQANEGKFAGWDAGEAIITSVRFVDVQDQNFTITVGKFAYSPTSAIPEPSTALFFIAGLLGLAALPRRQG